MECQLRFPHVESINSRRRGAELVPIHAAIVMLVIGVTGGIASGKSIVAQELRRRGAAVLDADRIGHAVLRLPEVKAALQARWGEEILRECVGARGAEVDRGAIARRVFADPPHGPRELEYLEGVTHPLITARMTKCLARWRQRGSVAAAVLDAPVLYKAGWDQFCDKILFVDAPLAVRAARAAQRGWSFDQLQTRQEMQPSIPFQRKRADVVIDNGGTLAATIQQIDTFWGTLFEGRKI